MRDIVEDLLRVWHSGRTGGLATLVRTFGSSPLPVGSAMLVDPDGGVHGSVSDGCYEAAVYEAAVEAARTGHRELRRFDATSGFEVSAECGTIDVFVEPFSRNDFPEFAAVAGDIARHKPVTVFTVVWHSDPEVIGQHLVTDRRHNTELVSLPESDVFVSSHTAPPRLIIFGANTFAAALTTQARLLGYRVTICDPREAFAVPASFPGAEVVVVDWPHRYLNAQAGAGAIDRTTAIVAATQDPKFEIPLLTIALRLPELGYLGALGSHSVHDHRLEALQAGGFGAETLSRLHAPAGFDVGARTPMEHAVAIAAELLAVRSAGSSRTPAHATAAAS
ncbi:XdhC family protein [Nocardia africana]|uniref:Xanthine dehydrogenase accessory protein XdhC n=1 Tax=Nocardia africana TaxID=134964 RepID=A0A378X4J9_9NOCA|nr:XdhC/CoxI family protein [Nocardia africana]MCC3317599.1 XdhC family protein [Nocardia africana]SUA48358.1 xanthine dehydrogenase accessory protein XdhC [Nocardia africana]